MDDFSASTTNEPRFCARAMTAVPREARFFRHGHASHELLLPKGLVKHIAASALGLTTLLFHPAYAEGACPKVASTRESPQAVGCGPQQVVVIGIRPPPIKEVIGLPDQNGFRGTSEGGGSASTAANATLKLQPAAENTSEITCGSTTTNPVIIATGEKVKPETDFIAQGLYAIGLTRTYRSKNTTSNVFGPNWPSSFDAIRLAYSTQSCRMIDNVCYPLSATATEPNGAQYKYSLIGGTEEYRVYGSTSKGTLYYLGSGLWELHRDDAIFTFNSAGRVTSQTIGGATLTYTYVSGKLTKVQNLVGQNVTLTYTGSRVTSIADPSGNTWTYTYNASGMLETVTSPGSSPDIRRYHYEVAAAPTLLTGISINNVRYSTYSYLADKRVQVSGLAGGEERDSFVYGTNQTTVTSAAEQPTTHSFTTLNGTMMPTAVSRASTATCAASASQTVYDANGYLDYQFDWNGNKTDYAYAADGKLMNVTSAAGTAAAKSRYNIWAGDEVAETSWRDASGALYAKVQYTYTFLSGLGVRPTSETWTDLRTGAVRQTTYAYTTHAGGALASMTASRSLPTGNAVSTTTFDALGNLLSTTNALGHQTTWSNYNALGLPARVTDANGVATDYVYDAKGQVLTATKLLPTGSRVTSFAYNNNRQLTDATLPDGSVSRFRYNAAARLDRIGNALSQFVTLPFDVATNRTLRRVDRQVPTMSGSTPVANAASEFVATTQLDSLGRPRQLIGNNGQFVTHAFDANSNLKTRTDIAARVTTYEYDAQDRLKRQIAPDVGITAYGYDTEGNLTSVTDPRGIPTTYAYNGLGQLTQRISRDTGTTTYSYDSAGRLATEQRANGSIVTYAWDKLDRMTSRTAAGVTESFTYDEGPYGKGRLTRLNDASGQTTYTYAADGQLT